MCKQLLDTLVLNGIDEIMLVSQAMVTRSVGLAFKVTTRYGY